MTWIVSIIVSLVSGVAGLFLAGLVANSCVSWYDISSREGASGYFVILIGLGGGIAGLFLGLIVARVIAWNFGPGFVKEMFGALLVVLFATGVSAWFCRVLADIPPQIDGCELVLEVEFRFPDSLDSETAPTAEGDWQFRFSSLAGQFPRKQVEGSIKTTSARLENLRWIVPAEVELFTERGSRAVTLSSRDATEAMGFMLPLPARPSAKDLAWSDWMPRQQANGQPWPSDKMSCRYRVQKNVQSSQ